MRPTAKASQNPTNAPRSGHYRPTNYSVSSIPALQGFLSPKPRRDCGASGWFVESVISASMVVLIVRTRRPFFQSWPSRWLLGASVGVWLVTLWLPYSPLNGVLGFTPLPTVFLAALAGILALYMLSAELLKWWFYRLHASL